MAVVLSCGCPLLLLLKSNSGNLPMESIHEVLGKTSLSQCFEGCPCWSISDHPSCLVHGYNRGMGNLGNSTLRSEVPLGSGSAEQEQPWQAILPGNGCQNNLKELEKYKITAEPASFKEHQTELEDYIVDDLVSKLVSHLHVPPEAHVSSSPSSDLLKSDHVADDSQCAKPTSSILDVESSKTSTTLCAENGNGLLPAGVPELGVSTGNGHPDAAKSRSALRGGYEKAGFGCRPQMNVSWAPEVYDPPCTITSHTSNQNRRRHHHYPKEDHKNRHRGKGNSRSDSQKKSQRKFRKLKHADESILCVSSIFPGTSQPRCLLRIKDDITPLVDDFMPRATRMRSGVSLQKACFIAPLLSLGESDFVTLDTMHSCYPKHSAAHKLLV